jgi:tight adherence protein B
MLPIFLSIGLAIIAAAALVVMSAGTDKTKRVNLRLAALDRDFAPAVPADRVADIRQNQQRMSAIPLLNRWLSRLNLAPASSLFLYQAGVTQTVGALLLISIGSATGAGCLVYFRFDSVLPALLSSAAFLPLPFLYVRRKRTQRLSRLEQQLPDALSMMVGALRVGHSLIASLESVGREFADPIGAEMRKCFEEQNYGIDLRTALVNLTLRVPVQDFRIFVAAVLIQRESGGNLAEVLEKVAQTTRDRFRLRKQISIHTAQGRMTGWVLSLLPVALGGFMYLLNPEGISVLWTRPVGLKLLYAAVGMDIAGALVIRKIVSIRI